MENMKILTAGDSSILIEFGKEISPEINGKITAVVHLMKEQHIEGVVEVIPAFSSLLVNYDPRVITYSQIRERMEKLLQDFRDPGLLRRRIWARPGKYRGERRTDA